MTGRYQSLDYRDPDGTGAGRISVARISEAVPA